MDALPNPDRDAAERALHDAEQERIAHELANQQRALSIPVASFKVDLADRAAVCPEHGNYTAHGYRLGKLAIWSKCPTCKEIADAAKRAEDDAREQRYQAERREAEAQAAGIPRRFRSGFAGFIADTEPKRAVLARCMDYAQQIASGELHRGRSLILSGLMGLGKTHLATAIVLHLLDSGVRRTRFMTCADLIGAVRATWNRNSQKTEEMVVEELGERLDLLVVDEVGVSSGSDGEKDILFRVLDRRYAEERPTVLATNLNTTRIREYLGERLYDRLREAYTWVKFDGWESVRPTAGKEVS